MENTIGRNRSIRNNYYSRKRRYKLEQEHKIAKIIKQLIVSLTIFVIVFTIRNINSSITNYISTKTSVILRTDAELNSAISAVRQFFASLNITNEKLKSVFNGYGFGVSSTNKDLDTIPLEMKNKIYDHTLLKNYKFEIPVKGILASGFGIRINPLTKEKEFHQGIDISAAEGDNIKSVLEGEVISIGNTDSLGNYIKIKHKDDLYSLYAHASYVAVEEGQKVNKGDVIAKVGSTGWSIGPHLHFELWKGDKMINPEKIFNFDREAIYN